MFEPLVEIWSWMISVVPKEWVPSRPRLNFLTVHYIYMLGMTIIGSIMLYPAGLLSYTDSLFFAAGMATQSGLNTVNVNNLNTYQQIVMMLIPCICTPIFINTFVVFVRLYWFEKRFAHLVKEIRSQRRTKTLSVTSRSKSQMREDKQDIDPDKLERGVNGRSITVLHETSVNNSRDERPDAARPIGVDDEDDGKLQRDAEHELSEKARIEHMAESVDPNSETSHGSSARSEASRSMSDTAVQPDSDVSQQGGPHRGITFAEDVATPARERDAAGLTLEPAENNLNKHISFLERQQREARQKSGALHIPGPRDFDRGEVPTELYEGENVLTRPVTRQSVRSTDVDPLAKSKSQSEELNGDDHPVRRGITINEPEHPPHRRDDTVSDDYAETSSRFSRLRQTISNRRHNRANNLGHRTKSFARTLSNLTARTREEGEIDPSPYLSWQATTGRNSTFFGLSQQQREELGGIEYRALKTLAGILLCYYFGFHILGLIVFVPWINGGPQAFWANIIRSDGQSITWWGIFTPASMFNDLGFTLTPDSMVSFQYAILPLLFGSFLIIIGNTGFPCMLRFVIWLLSKFARKGSAFWEELKFLLDHPRRCFTLLFPSRATWWLFWVLVLLNGLDLIFFIILDLNDDTVTSLPAGYRVLNGWFQAASTRTAGFACVNISGLHPAIQVSYLIMMYISVFPIAISVRRTNVYEEKSLGIFGGEEETDANGEPSYVGQHLRRQLSFDLWYIFLGFFIIAIVEGTNISDNSGDKVSFTLFAVLFEIVSAYGTVGLSLGYPGIDASFSAEFHVISKLIIIAMMLRGRHRGLPYALDRAILLPSEKLQQKENEEAERRRPRFGSIFRTGLDGLNGGNEPETDEYGLPKQHLGLANMPTVPLTADDQIAPSQRVLSRRMSAATTASATGRTKNGRSLARVLAGGLGAGPTISKQD